LDLELVDRDVRGSIGERLLSGSEVGQKSIEKRTDQYLQYL